MAFIPIFETTFIHTTCLQMGIAGIYSGQGNFFLRLQPLSCVDHNPGLSSVASASFGHHTHIDGLAAVTAPCTPTLQPQHHRHQVLCPRYPHFAFSPITWHTFYQIYASSSCVTPNLCSLRYAL